MDIEPILPADPNPSWPATPLLVMCAVCLVVGFLAGYLLRGSASRHAPPVATAAKLTGPPAGMPSSGDPAQDNWSKREKIPTLDELKRMADKKAEPLLAKLKTDPENPDLENQIGLVYENAHQFKEAAGYFQKSLRADPKNVGVRADFASCLYYTGDVDSALAQLNQSLTYDPKHAGTLMNIGIIKWRGKNDVEGAVAAWQMLLQYHPDFPQKDLVQHMITQATQTKTAQSVGEGQKG